MSSGVPICWICPLSITTTVSRHGQGLLLVVGDIDEGDAHGLLDALKFVLHVLAQPHIQRPQGLIQQQHLGTVHQGAGNGHPLLLSAGQGRHRALLKAPSG